ncbi:hypothetical protein [Streptomyces dysideae]|uniref:hypothetical protein n=1 Tax=Streptomyces dysideae TaxID=909626 RepID=UPI001F3C651B|nr:hypothetical protein [Streptomyces dysideae]
MRTVPAPAPPQPRPNGQLRISKLFRKTLVSALVAGGSLLLTSVLNEDDNDLWQWTVSIVLGCAALIVQYLIEFSERLEDMEAGQKRRIREMRDSLTTHHLEMRQAVDESFAKINAATELFSKVDRSVLRSDGVTRLAQKYTQVGEHGSAIVKTFAQEELARLAQLMESLSNGSADCAGENHEWLMDLTTCAKRTLYATSTTIDRDFWTSEPAKRYLAVQADAIKNRGVEIRRLFLVETLDEVTPSLELLCERQRTFGIDARIAVQSELQPNAQVTPLNDFIIFDGELCYETEPDVRVVPAKTTLKMTREHVQERINRFTVLWEATAAG